MQPLIYGRVPRGRRKTLALEALERVGLSDRVTHMPYELSGGQRQRVSIARAIVNRPSLILADEPTGNLDRESGERIIELLRSLTDQGLTVVMVTHNPEQAKRTKRVLEIQDGSLCLDETQEKY